jgi:hypothetical protein
MDTCVKPATSAEPAADVELVRRLFGVLGPVLDERMTRLLVGALAIVLGRGGGRVITEATGIRSKRIWQGKRDLEELHEASAEAPLREQRVRRSGGGRKRLVDKDGTLLDDLAKLVEPTTREDPEEPLRWTTKSLRHLTEELKAKGHTVSQSTVADLLHRLGYSLRASRKRLNGKPHPHRDAQIATRSAAVSPGLGARARRLP